MSDLLPNPKLSRRKVLQAAAVGALAIDPALRAAVYAQGSDKPEKEGSSKPESHESPEPEGEEEPPVQHPNPWEHG